MGGVFRRRNGEEKRQFGCEQDKRNQQQPAGGGFDVRALENQREESRQHHGEIHELIKQVGKRQGHGELFDHDRQQRRDFGRKGDKRHQLGVVGRAHNAGVFENDDDKRVNHQRGGKVGDTLNNAFKRALQADVGKDGLQEDLAQHGDADKINDRQVGAERHNEQQNRGDVTGVNGVQVAAAAARKQQRRKHDGRQPENAQRILGEVKPAQGIGRDEEKQPGYDKRGGALRQLPVNAEQDAGQRQARECPEIVDDRENLAVKQKLLQPPGGKTPFAQALRRVDGKAHRRPVAVAPHKVDGMEQKGKVDETEELPETFAIKPGNGIVAAADFFRPVQIAADMADFFPHRGRQRGKGCGSDGKPGGYRSGDGNGEAEFFGD